MQEALLPPAHPELHSGFAPKPLCFGDRRLSSLSSPNLLTNGDDLFYGCYSPFGPSGGGLSSPSPRATSLSHRSSSSDSHVDDGHGTAVTERRLHLARLALQFQEVANRYKLCLSHLADAADEAAALRVENAELRVANNDLARRIAMLGRKQGSAIALADVLRYLRLGEEQTMPAPPTPTGPAVQARLPGSAAEEHAVLPKSISIRSTSYLKMNQSGKHRVSKPVNVGSQRVFVGMDGASSEGEEQKGGEKKDQLTSGLEFEVFNQGMFKTELCNKWEETGSCPYGDQCQFAHGVGELRPVIRHPRYRTEVCRMVLAGGVCPYGQRCHFRHSIIPADRLLLRQRCSSPTATLSLPASLPSV